MNEQAPHIERAKKALQAAKLLQEGKLIEDAYSRAYYALLHLGIAILIKAGEQPAKTHAGLVSKLFSILEKTGLTREDLRKISRFQAMRESGDYAPIPAVTKSDLAELIEYVEQLYLKTAGEKP